MTDDNWTKLHEDYKKRDWIGKPSIFAKQVLSYFPEGGSVLELGAGLGQDSQYFAARGYDVTATDLNIDKLSNNQALQQLGRPVVI